MSVKSFRFKDEEQSVKSWQEIPLKVCSILHERHKDSFESILYIILGGRDFFSRNAYQFITSKEIADTGIYINTNMSKSVALALTNEILSHFGYNKNDLIIDIE